MSPKKQVKSKTSRKNGSAVSRPSKAATRSVPTANGGVVVSGEELWDVGSGGIGVGVGNLLFTPGTAGLTRLDQLAALYDEYRLRRAVVKYRSGVGTTRDGRIRYGIDYVAGNTRTPQGDLPVSAGQVAALVPCQDHPIWRSSEVRVNVVTAMKASWMLTGQPDRLSTAFALAWSNESEMATAGEFRVEYEVEFRGIGQPVGGGGGGGGGGTLSGTFLENDVTTAMAHQSDGLISAEKWSTIGSDSRVLVVDGQVLSESVGKLATVAPPDSSRLDITDGPSTQLSRVDLVVGTGATVPSGATFLVEAIISATEGRGDEGGVSPDNDGPSHGLQSKWYACAALNAGENQLISLVDSCPFKIGVGPWVVDREFSKLSVEDHDGKAYTARPGGGGSGAPSTVGFQSSIRAHWSGQLTFNADWNGTATPVDWALSPNGSPLQYLGRNVGNNDSAVFATNVRIRMTAINPAARAAVKVMGKLVKSIGPRILNAALSS